MRSQVLSYDHVPVELVKSYYPVEPARGTAMTEMRKIRGGTSALLPEMGYPPRHTVDRVPARVPAREQFEVLQLPNGLPVLRAFRVAYGDAERPINNRRGGQSRALARAAKRNSPELDMGGPTVDPCPM
ncbi:MULTISPECIES: UTRA domain-containing protein [unclassified Streptomyces]|uniref:UTRA domain-containing protein n=1 Tax=unclassified Streptomyces TaxID=2593676 RepID=UPI00382E17E9